VNVSLPRLGRALGFAAQWQRYDGRARDWLRIDPPMPVAEQIPSMSSEWPFLPLAGLVTCPTLRRDGSLLAEAGYDSETGLYLTDTLRLPPIPERPTKRDAEAALALLLDLIKSFPFADDKSRSVALSTLITPVARAALGPVVPAHGASAPAAGSGKSYLGNVAAYIATGRPCAVVTADHKPEETDKRLIGELLNGHALVSLDNIRGVLASACSARRSSSRCSICARSARAKWSRSPTPSRS
jgi:putative DNA primase/helicase